jgi:hypothetical protein
MSYPIGTTVRALGLPALVIVVAYVSASMVFRSWILSPAATVGLFFLGLLCCGWAAARAKGLLGVSLWGALIAAALVSVVHFLVKNALVAAAINRPLSQFDTLIQLAFLGIVYTLPATLLVAWAATKLPAARVNQ